MKLAIFDVDGTLSDSQNQIVAAMEHGFRAVGLPLPTRQQTLSIVGLSLTEAMRHLVPDAGADVHEALVAHYRGSFRERRQTEMAPLYPGAAETLNRLAGIEDLFLGIATGKSRRGLDALCVHYGLSGYFVTRQVADDNPSKPAPGMVLAALSEAGVAAEDAVMIGDTTFDMEMGRAAGVATIGVDWGYHPVSALRAAGAGQIVSSFAELEAAVNDVLWGKA